MTKTLIDRQVNIQNSVINPSDTWIRTYSHIKDSIIGGNVFIGFKCQIKNASVQDRTQIANSCIITGKKQQEIFISKDVWLGAKVRVDPGVHIGEGAIIGAGTHLIGDVKPYSIMIGNPGKLLKKRKIIKDSELTNSAFLRSIKKLFQQAPPDFSKGFANYTGSLIPNYLQVGNKTVISGRKDNVFPQGGFKFGENVVIEKNCVLEAAGGIDIGAGVTLGGGTIVITTSHDYRFLSLPQTSEKVFIGNNVQIGHNSIILPGVNLPSDMCIPNKSIVFKNLTIKRWE